MNKIFSLKVIDVPWYDEFDWFIIAAKDENEALVVMNEFAGKLSPRKQDLIISEVWISHNLSPQVILDSFNAW